MTLQCTPKEYGLFAIVGAVNDARPDKSASVRKFANNADADRDFFSENRGVSYRAEKQEVFKKYDYRH